MKLQSEENDIKVAQFKIESQHEAVADLQQGFEVEFEVITPGARQENSQHQDILDGIDDANRHIDKIKARIESLNNEIDRLTNHCDGIDYITAVVCGVVAGIIDSIYVGEWNFKSAKDKANADINKEIEEFAKKCGYKDNGKGLQGAIEFLEKKFPLPGDNEWKFIDDSKISASSHHLDDYCHHPTIVGLICCIIVQFTGKTTYHNRDGVKIPEIDVEVNEYGELYGNSPVSRLFCGVVNWFIICAKTIANAKGHWMSDLAGSSHSKNGGAGLPGSFMSLLKELAPIFNSKDKDGNRVNAFAESLRKAYQNGIGTGKNQVNLGVFNSLFEGASSKFDYRTERAVKNLLKKQTVPIIINEALVRGVYFIRRLIQEVKTKKGFRNIEWRKILPYNNRTIARMMTISVGTFCACDIGDATIRSGIKNGFNVYNPKFWSDTILRVNFVGIGRFAIAITTDIGMGIKRTKRCGELIGANNEFLLWTNTRMLYKQGEMWIAAENTAKNICDCYAAMEEYYHSLCRDIIDDQKCLDSISQSRSLFSTENKETLKTLADRLKYLS